jgi:Fe-S-cluster-containing dehydrogenase component/DMSO reductase anchor subunit
MMKTALETADLPVAVAPRRVASPTMPAVDFSGGYQSLIDRFLAEQRALTAVEKFSRHHPQMDAGDRTQLYRDLIPIRGPQPGEQYAFTVDLDKCSGCKACVSACHSLNGLDEDEVWRKVGLLTSNSYASDIGCLPDESPGIQQHITTACHHCVEPACLEGCPVLAYDKDPITGIVRHLDDQCIGCNYCVMKCPYEVPKYSSRLGIVRKCDMCANRLAVGEAPACAQACPSAAIKITLVKPVEVESQYRQSNVLAAVRNPFLADSPDPQITLPATRFISLRGLRADLFAADADHPRLDESHWPLAIMLLLTQAAVGMFLVAGIARLNGVTDGSNELVLAAFTIFMAGLGASVAHLGQPFRAWRCFLGWRRSWLSREIILFNALAAVAAPVAVFALCAEFHLRWLEPLARALQKMLAPMDAVVVAIGLIAVFTSSMVYVDTKRPFWSLRFVAGNFFGAGLLLGTAFGAGVLSWSNGALPPARCAVGIALAVNATLFLWRRLEHLAALRQTKSPVHLNARVVTEMLPWALRTSVVLFALSMAAGVLALANFLHAAPAWITITALAMLGSELVARHIFFAASAGKRMPGGVPA